MKKIICSALVSLFLFPLAACGGEKDVHEVALEPSKPVNVAVPAAAGDLYSALPNKSYGWGMKKNLNAPPDIPESAKALLKKYGAVYIDEQTPRALYLTFDNGYENGYTSGILDVLKRQKVPAAFFVTGQYLKEEGDLIRRMLDEGHIVGNHRVRHPSLPEVTSTEKVQKEITELDDRFFADYGRHMQYLRAPRGEYSERTLAITRDLGYKNVFWSFAYMDWDVNKQKGAAYAKKQILDGTFGGCILLLHAVSKDNAAVLEEALAELKSKGFSFKSLDEYPWPLPSSPEK
jgi:peptidoglycan-N-acetylmuramic acid deacetylase